MIVCKFGGSSVADAKQFEKIKNILGENPERKVIVVSAPGKRNSKETKITDLLYASYDLAKKNIDFTQPFELIQKRFGEIANDLGLSKSILEDLEKLKQQLLELDDTVTADFAVSRGEYLNARLMAEYLGFEFYDALDLIDIDYRGRATDETYSRIASTLDPNKKYVIPGFYGKNEQNGKLKTFSRGGSDITGSIIANALNASVYENWTDVSGLLMADPRIISNPKPMKSVSYRELRELAYSGANVFHDEAIFPCRAKGIQVNIKNTNSPSDEGTFIGPEPKQALQTVTGIAGRKNFALIYIEKNMMNKERGFGRRVLGILESQNISYEHSPTGIDSMSIIVDQGEFESVEQLVLEDIQRTLSPDKIKVHKDLALIATVGHGMSHKIGVSAQLFSALAKEGINIRIIDQGSSEINIIVGVEEKDFESAISSIYNTFVS